MSCRESFERSFESLPVRVRSKVQRDVHKKRAATVVECGRRHHGPLDLRQRQLRLQTACRYSFVVERRGSLDEAGLIGQNRIPQHVDWREIPPKTPPYLGAQLECCQRISAKCREIGCMMYRCC